MRHFCISILIAGERISLPFALQKLEVLHAFEAVFSVLDFVVFDIEFMLVGVLLEAESMSGRHCGVRYMES